MPLHLLDRHGAERSLGGVGVGAMREERRLEMPLHALRSEPLPLNEEEEGAEWPGGVVAPVGEDLDAV